MGQRLQCLDEAVHDQPGLSIIATQEDGKAAHALDKRRHIGFPELLAELNEIAFLVPELLSISNRVGAAQNVELRAKPLTVFASGVTRSTPGPTFGQMSPQLYRLTIGGVRELVDRFVAH